MRTAVPHVRQAPIRRRRTSTSASSFAVCERGVDTGSAGRALERTLRDSSRWCSTGSSSASPGRHESGTDTCRCSTSDWHLCSRTAPVVELRRGRACAVASTVRRVLDPGLTGVLSHRRGHRRHPGWSTGRRTEAAGTYTPARCRGDRTLQAALVAATAMSHGLGVWTCNPKDFAGVDGLTVVAVPRPPLRRS